MLDHSWFGTLMTGNLPRSSDLFRQTCITVGSYLRRHMYNNKTNTPNRHTRRRLANTTLLGANEQTILHGSLMSAHTMRLAPPLRARSPFPPPPREAA